MMEEKKRIMRPHLTKEHRLPKCFKEVEKIIRSVKACQQNYKTILANSRLRGRIHKKVYSMTVNILKYYSYIQKIIDKVHLLEKEQYLRREIASVLIYELIFGNGFLPGESKVVKTIQLYEKDIFHAHELLQNNIENSLIIEINIPRYARVHTLVTTVQYVIKDLISNGYHQVVYDDKLSEENYLELIKNLNKRSFLVDFHFKDMLVFEQHENLVSFDIYKNGHIFLQDKSSYIPVHVLNPHPGCAVLDACAAPGMKTTHIAAKMKNKGILVACERDKSRFECLKEMLDRGSVKICKTLCKDFSLIDPLDQAYSTIEYILLDPSCSGSGMVNRMDEITDTETSKNTDRLMKLAGFQIILLKHSLKFPSVKRVVYSTCSIHEEENEYVIQEALKAFSRTFKLIPAMPEWSHRGSEKFEFGKLCLRTDPKVHLTNGFFVAVFERIRHDEYPEEYQQKHEVINDHSFKKQKREFLKQKKECHEKTICENYSAVNVKHKYDTSYHSESCQINDTEHNALLSKNDNNSTNELQQNLECFRQKRKRKEKTNECSYDLNILNYAQFNESKNFKPEQNTESTQQINKKQKNRKHSNKCSYDSNILNTDEFNESTLRCNKLDEHLNVSLPENNASTLTRKEKSKNNVDYYKSDTVLGNENVELFAAVTKLHKKKKKKKKHLETEIFLPDSFSQEKQNMFPEQKCEISTQDDSNLRFELQNDSIFSASGTSSCKKKKKKKKEEEHLNLDCIQSYGTLKQNNISDGSGVINSYSRYQSEINTSVNNETSQELVDLVSLHKKTKKKKKHLDVSSAQFCDTPKENEDSDSYTINDSHYKNESVKNMFVNDEISEKFIDSKLSQKKKKKKKKHKEKHN